jgi:hypothetical protein
MLGGDNMSSGASRSGNTGKKTLEQRIADCIRMLNASKPGVIVAAVTVLKQVLASAGTDFHGLAHGVENLGKEISNEERKKIWDMAVQHTENRLHGADDFIDSSGKPTWQSVALYCQRNIHRLAPKHHDFINKVAANTVYDREPTPPMHKYLFSLFLQLGGKII